MVISDEKKFSLDGPDSPKVYWRDLRNDPRVSSRRNFGGGTLMVWSAFSRQGTLTLAFPSTHMDSNEYQDVLAANWVPFLAANPGQNRVLQKYNAPVHVSRSTKAWLQAQGMVTMA